MSDWLAMVLVVTAATAFGLVMGITSCAVSDGCFQQFSQWVGL